MMGTPLGISINALICPSDHIQHFFLNHLLNYYCDVFEIISVVSLVFSHEDDIISYEIAMTKRHYFKSFL